MMIRYRYVSTYSMVAIRVWRRRRQGEKREAGRRRTGRGRERGRRCGREREQRIMDSLFIPVKKKEEKRRRRSKIKGGMRGIINI